MFADACMHCTEAYCLSDCPTNAISRDLKSGKVLINEKTCIGCGNCAENCIYDNINMTSVENKTDINQISLKATKCDLCESSRLAPACERSCPTKAIKRIDLSNFELFTKWTEK